jgi:hypothetical protein
VPAGMAAARLLSVICGCSTPVNEAAARSSCRQWRLCVQIRGPAARIRRCRRWICTVRLLRRAHTRERRTVAASGCVVPVRVVPLRQAGSGGCGIGGRGAGPPLPCGRPASAGGVVRPVRWPWYVGGGTDDDGSLLGGVSRGLPCPG